MPPLQLYVNEKYSVSFVSAWVVMVSRWRRRGGQGVASQLSMQRDEGGEKGGRQGFMSRVILLLSVAYYGDFLKLSVASAGNNANRKWIIIGLQIAAGIR